MSNRVKIKQKVDTNNPLEVLATLLGTFDSTLGRKPQPTDDEVRNLYIELTNKWDNYCSSHAELTKNYHHLWVLNVKKRWQEIWTKPQAMKS